MTDERLTIKEYAAPVRNHRHGIVGIACHPVEDVIAVADVDMLCEVWRGSEIVAWFDVRSLDPKARAIQRVRSLFFSQDGALLFVVAGERLMALDYSRRSVAWQYTAPRTWGFLVASPTDATLVGEDRIVASFDNGWIVLFSLRGSLLHRWKDEETPRAIRFDGKKLVGTDTFRLFAWNLEGKRIMRRPLPQRGLTFQTAPNDRLAAVRSLESVFLVDTETGVVVAVIPVGVGLPKMAFHPHVRALAILERHAVVLVDYRGRFLQRCDVEGAVALSLAFNAEGDRLLIGCSDRSVRQFEIDPNIFR